MVVGWMLVNGHRDSGFYTLLSAFGLGKMSFIGSCNNGCRGGRASTWSSPGAIGRHGRPKHASRYVLLRSQRRLHFLSAGNTRGGGPDYAGILTERLHWQQVLLDSRDVPREWLAKGAWKGRRRAEFPPWSELGLVINCFVSWDASVAT